MEKDYFPNYRHGNCIFNYNNVALKKNQQIIVVFHETKNEYVSLFGLFIREDIQLFLLSQIHFKLKIYKTKSDAISKYLSISTLASPVKTAIDFCFVCFLFKEG